MQFSYKRLAERVAAEGIVVVTINYRLGPFGLIFDLLHYLPIFFINFVFPARWDG